MQEQNNDVGSVSYLVMPITGLSVLLVWVSSHSQRTKGLLDDDNWFQVYSISGE